METTCVRETGSGSGSVLVNHNTVPVVRKVAEITEMAKFGVAKVPPEDFKAQFGLMEGEEVYYCPYNRSHQVLQSKYLQHLLKCRHNYDKAAKAGKSVPKVEICPYKPAVHHVPEVDFSQHLQLCPAKKQSERILRSFKDVKLEGKMDAVKPNTSEPEKLQCSRGTPEGVESALEPIHFTFPLDPLNALGEVCCYADGNGEHFSEQYEEGEEDQVEEEQWDSDDQVGGYDPTSKLESNFYYRNPSGLTKSERRQFQASQVQKYPLYARQQALRQVMEEDKKALDKTGFFFQQKEKIREFGINLFLRPTNERPEACTKISSLKEPKLDSVLLVRKESSRSSGASL